MTVCLQPKLQRLNNASLEITRRHGIGLWNRCNIGSRWVLRGLLRNLEIFFFFPGAQLSGSWQFRIGADSDCKDFVEKYLNIHEEMRSTGRTPISMREMTNRSMPYLRFDATSNSRICKVLIEVFYMMLGSLVEKRPSIWGILYRCTSTIC